MRGPDRHNRRDLECSGHGMYRDRRDGCPHESRYLPETETPPFLRFRRPARPSQLPKATVLAVASTTSRRNSGQTTAWDEIFSMVLLKRPGEESMSLGNHPGVPRTIASRLSESAISVLACAPGPTEPTTASGVTRLREVARYIDLDSTLPERRLTLKQGALSRPRASPAPPLPAASCGVPAGGAFRGATAGPASPPGPPSDVSIASSPACCGRGRVGESPVWVLDSARALPSRPPDPV